MAYCLVIKGKQYPCIICLPGGCYQATESHLGRQKIRWHAVKYMTKYDTMWEKEQENDPK